MGLLRLFGMISGSSVLFGELYTFSFFADFDARAGLAGPPYRIHSSVGKRGGSGSPSLFFDH